MKTIYKYSIDPFQMPVTLPKGAVVLTAELQDQVMYIWAIIDTAEKETENRSFKVFATGQQINYLLDKLTYINTVHQVDGWMVFHVFELKLK